MFILANMRFLSAALMLVSHTADDGSITLNFYTEIFKVIFLVLDFDI